VELAAAVAPPVSAGPGLRKLDAKFGAEEADEDKRRESALLGALSADAKRLSSFAARGGLSPDEAKRRDDLHKSLAGSSARVDSIAKDEQSQATGRTARQAARLAKLNKQARENLERVNKKEQEESQEQYKRDVLDTQERIKKNGGLVDKAAHDSQRDDTDYIAGLKKTISAHGDLISRLEKEEYANNHRAMSEREDAGKKRQSELEDAVHKSSGPAGFSERESKFERSMRAQLERDAKDVSNAADDTQSHDARVAASCSRKIVLLWTPFIPLTIRESK